MKEMKNLPLMQIVHGISKKTSMMNSPAEQINILGHRINEQKGNSDVYVVSGGTFSAFDFSDNSIMIMQATLRSAFSHYSLYYRPA